VLEIATINPDWGRTHQKVNRESASPCRQIGNVMAEETFGAPASFDLGEHGVVHLGTNDDQAARSQGRQGGGPGR
jgi:hypothetical protein